MRAFLAALRRWVSPYPGLVTLATAGVLVELAFQNALPLSLGFLINDAITPKDSAKVALIVSIMVVAAVAYAIAGVVGDRLYAILVVRVLNDVRGEMFEHVQRLPVTAFRRLRPGDVASRFSLDLGAVENALTVSVPTAALAVLGLAFSFTILFILQWQLALVAAFGLAVAGLAPRPFARRSEQAEYEMRGEQDDVGDAVTESIAGRMVVKAFGLERPTIAAFHGHLRSLHGISVRATFLSYLVERAPNLAVIAVQLAVLWIGALLVIDGSISLGVLVSFNGIFLAVSQYVFGITVSLPELVSGAASYRRIKEILDEEVEDDVRPGVPALAPLRESIELRDVAFSHTPDAPVLHDVTLSIPRGSFVALVGVSGSGKSTLINLLLGFDEPTAGAISIDGRDLRDVPRTSLRERMGVVLQDTFLFDTTIAENVRLARQDATDDEVVEACRQAGIHEHISALRDGYETAAGEGGARLSGGQRQRIAIARAILRHPELLIVDEATTALDPDTEAEVNATLRAAAAGRTTIAATHRLAAVTHADLIAVLDGGRLVEHGTHAQLLALGGRYRALWDKQSGIVVRAQPEYHLDTRVLRVLPLFDTLDDAQLAEIADHLASTRHEGGETIFLEGDRGDALYFVARGTLEIVRHGRRIAVLEDGDHFGEIALISPVRRTATARTLAPTVLLSLSRAAFLDLVDRHPSLRAAAQESARVRAAEWDEPDGAGEVSADRHVTASPDRV